MEYSVIGPIRVHPSHAPAQVPIVCETQMMAIVLKLDSRLSVGIYICVCEKLELGYEGSDLNMLRDS